MDGQQELFIDRIVDERKRGRRTQYLVRWHREGPEGNIWLNEEELEECEVLDTWLTNRGEQELEKGEEQEDRLEEEDRPRLTITIPPPTTFLFRAERGVTTSHNDDYITSTTSTIIRLRHLDNINNRTTTSPRQHRQSYHSRHKDHARATNT